MRVRPVVLSAGVFFTTALVFIAPTVGPLLMSNNSIGAEPMLRANANPENGQGAATRFAPRRGPRMR